MYIMTLMIPRNFEVLPVTVSSYGAIQNLICSFISEEQRQVTQALATAGEFEKSEEGK